MHRPKLLLLDKPTAGVDPQVRRDFWDQIHDLAAAGMTVLVATHYIDEAERCDRIVYLANGKLITQGTVADVIARSGLVNFRAAGDGVRALIHKVEGRPGVEHAAYFGAALHVSGPDRDLLARTVASAGRDGVTWTEVDPTLEDAFIALMARAGRDERVHA